VRCLGNKSTTLIDGRFHHKRRKSGDFLNAARNATSGGAEVGAEIAKSDHRLSRLTNDVMLGKPG
jgi:hypothetical protein